MKYVFEVTVNPGKRLEDYVETWIAESEVIQREPGACGTRLHRCIDQPNKLLAIASWESKEHRDAAIARLQEVPELVELRSKHKELVTFRLIGEFHDPEWVVLPPGYTDT